MGGYARKEGGPGRWLSRADGCGGREGAGEREREADNKRMKEESLRDGRGTARVRALVSVRQGAWGSTWCRSVSISSEIT